MNILLINIIVISLLCLVWYVSRRKSNAYFEGRDAAAKGDEERAIALFTQAIASNPNDAYAYDARGNAYGRKGEHLRALQDYQRAADIEPDHAGIIGNLARCQTILGQHDLAIATLDKAVKIDATHAGNHMFLAYALECQGNYRGAIAAYSRVLELREEDASAYAGRAQAYAQMNDDTHALADFEKASEIRLPTMELLINRGKCLLRLGRAKDALSTLTRAIELNNEDGLALAFAYNARGYALTASGDHAGAKADHMRAVELLRDDAEMTGALGDARTSAGELADAVATLDRALALDPGHAVNHGRRARALLAKGDIDGALAGYARAIELSPTLGWCHVGIAMARHRKGDLAGAIAAYDHVIATGLDDTALIYRHRGMAYQANGDPESAISDFDVALERDPADQTALQQRAYALINCREFQRAIEDFSRCIAHEPDNFAGYMGRGHARYESLDFHGAIADYDTALALDDGSPELHYNRAIALERVGGGLGMEDGAKRYLAERPNAKTAIELDCRAFAFLITRRPEDGLPLIERALELQPDNPNFLGTRGRICESLGRSREAIGDFRRLLSLDPRPVLKAEALEALERLESRG